ncbi:hypothetical protein GCM10010978_33180 [Compostibacillus humi]|uniref:Uncharacterized protein n=1 Tax=Compostibacillus humi TaxID=1245525 RepID=A0A8J2TRJ6_9BACI|nr:hypothetical protein GCM10010978_33180 [Compostibacillus humi]
MRFKPRSQLSKDFGLPGRLAYPPLHIKPCHVPYTDYTSEII